MLQKIKDLLNLNTTSSPSNIPQIDWSFKSVDIQSLPSLSIIIPAYEMKGTGHSHIRRSLESLKKQSWKNFEVVISDHSTSDMIFDVVKEFKDVLEISYHRNSEDIGSSCMNANNAIDNSKYDYIKFLFQDDFLSHENSLLYGMQFLIWSRKSWVATACNHREDSTNRIYHNHYPRIIQGELFNALNSLGCPSIMYLKKSDIRFDKRLPALMDIDYYEQFKMLYGAPGLLNDINVTIGVHEASVTNNGGAGDKVQVKKELGIVNEKYNTNVSLK